MTPMQQIDLFYAQRHRVEIIYGDYIGQCTTRTIDVTRGYRDGATGLGYLDAWCLLRESWRCFRDDRVQSWRVAGAEQPTMNSLLLELQHLTMIGAPQFGTEHTSAARTPDREKATAAAVEARAETLDELVAMIGVVVYMARADGRIAKYEVRTIDRFVTAWGRDLVLPEDLADVAQTAVPRADYLSALRLLAGRPRLTRASVLAGASAVATASAGIKEDEAVVLLEVASLLGLPPEQTDLA